MALFASFPSQGQKWGKLVYESNIRTPTWIKLMGEIYDTAIQLKSFTQDAIRCFIYRRVICGKWRNKDNLVHYHFS